MNPARVTTPVKKPSGGSPYSCPTRSVLDRVGDEWTLLVIFILEGGTLRFGELKRAIEGISPRVLTLTLRSLERDELVKRQSFATIPPRVDYSVTELGKSLATAIKPVVLWGEQNETKFKNCQKKYDSVL